jgi:hypothetical protein
MYVIDCPIPPFMRITQRDITHTDFMFSLLCQAVCDEMRSLVNGSILSPHLSNGVLAFNHESTQEVANNK